MLTFVPRRSSVMVITLTVLNKAQALFNLETAPKANISFLRFCLFAEMRVLKCGGIIRFMLFVIVEMNGFFGFIGPVEIIIGRNAERNAIMEHEKRMYDAFFPVSIVRVDFILANFNGKPSIDALS